MQEETMIIVRSSFDSADAVIAELGNHLDKIEELLVRYHFSSRGRVHSVSLDSEGLILGDEGKGSFVVRYAVGLFNACADLDYTEKSWMRIGFKPGLEEGAVILSGENIPEREPDEL